MRWKIRNLPGSGLLQDINGGWPGISVGGMATFGDVHCVTISSSECIPRSVNIVMASEDRSVPRFGGVGSLLYSETFAIR
jgi:hypothetical protein